MFTILPYLFHIISSIVNRLITKPPPPKILYESPNFKFINKPPDLRINSNNPNHSTLQTFLLEKYPQEANAKLIHNFYFAHRLDYATSGIICIPMTKPACKLISEAFQSRKTEKYYLGIVRGILSQRVIIVDHPIGEDCTGKAIQKMCIADDPHCTNPRSAKTLVLALEDGFYENYPGTKVLIRPITGRRHQIRVHCASLGHTIVGDYTYSNKMDIKPHRMFLHSFRLVLPNELESVDLQTEDPFVENHYKDWLVHNRYFTSMEEAFSFLHEYANAKDNASKCNRL